MNIIDMHAASAGTVGANTVKASGQFSFLGAKGQVVEGVISKISSRISINFNGTEIFVSRSAVQNAKEGESRKFKIMDVSNNSIVLKEVGNSAEVEKAGQYAGTTSTTVGNDPYSFSDFLENSLQSLGTQEKANSVVTIVTGKDCQSLEEEGGASGCFATEEFEETMERIKEQREYKRDSLERHLEKRAELEEDMERVAIGQMIAGAGSALIAKKLEEANLPATEANIAKVATAMELVSQVPEMSDRIKAYLISHTLPPTIENVYQGLHSRQEGLGAEQVAPALWNELSSQVEKIAQGMEDIPAEKAVEMGKWLLANDLPVTEENIRALAGMEQAEQNLTPDKAMECILDGMQSGLMPEQASLDDTLIIIAGEAIQGFEELTEETIDAAVQAGMDPAEMNLNQLLDLQNGLQAETAGAKKVVVDTAGNLNGLDISAVTAKRQLEEIRLRMTVKVAVNLQAKGIALDTTSLNRIVEGLRELEQEYYQKMLTGHGAAATEGNINVLQQVSDKVAGLKNAPAYILGSSYPNRNIMTIDTLHEEAVSMKARLDKAGETYEALMTAPRKDLGDSIQKAFANIPEMLEDLGMEDTEAARRAVRILGYNSMEITVDSINSMKEYDAQVNYMVKSLTPTVTMELLRSGENPLDMTIPDLNERLQEIREGLDITDEERFSKYLWQLEKNDAISPEERDGYIGIYRLLHQIEKSDGAALGAIVQADMDVTMRNLLTAVRSKKSSGMDAKIDDSFGALESAKVSSESITNQINRGFDVASQQEEGKGEAQDDFYGKYVMQEIMQKVTPDKLAEVSEHDLQKLLHMTPEKLQEALKEAETSPTEEAYYEAMAQDIRELFAKKPEMQEFLDTYQIPDTIYNLKAVNQLIENGQTAYAQAYGRREYLSEEDRAKLEAVTEQLPEAMAEPEEWEKSYTEALDLLEKAVKTAYSEEPAEASGIQNLMLLQGGIRLGKMLTASERYEVPVQLGDELVSINVTLVHGKEQKGKVHIASESNLFGKMQIDLSVKETGITGLALFDNRTAADLFTEQGDKLKTALNQEGFEEVRMDYGVDVRKKPSYEAGTEKQETKTLYQAAKVVLTHIKNLQDEGTIKLHNA